MEQTLTAWLIPALTLVVGIAVGFLIARLAPSAAPSRTQRQMEEMQARFEAYQNEVVTHFNTTASLVKKLTQSYQDVQEHLSDGANRLALDELTRQRLLAALSSSEGGEKRETAHGKPSRGGWSLPEDRDRDRDPPPRSAEHADRS